MEFRRENLPIEHLHTYSKKYVDLKAQLIRTERHILKEMGFICQVEHPQKFISNYLATLGTPPELRQEAWNLANDSLRTTLCVRFKSEVVPLVLYMLQPEAFKCHYQRILHGGKHLMLISLVYCRVLAHLYTLPKAQYIPVCNCKERGSFATSNRSWDSPHESIAKEGSSTGPAANVDSSTTKGSSSAVNQEVGKDALVKAALDKIKELKIVDDPKSMPTGEESREDPESKLMSDHRTEAGGESNKGRDRDRDRDREKERTKSRDQDRGRESDRERGREDSERDRDKVKEKGHRLRDKGKDSGRFK